MFVIPPAISRPADVLMNAPVSTVIAGKSFQVGVWYQAFSGGSRAYSLLVDSPSGKIDYFRAGHASPARWEFWQVPTSRPGRYLVTYAVDGTMRQFTVIAKRQ